MLFRDALHSTLKIYNHKPDGSIVPINGDVTNVGDFRTLVIIDATFPPGTYTISGNYQNTDLGSVKFTVK